MRRFHSAATELGAVPPAGASLKRMFAYWEAGEREVGVEAYRLAFCAIYQSPPEVLGFRSSSSSEADFGVCRETPRAIAAPLLTRVDAETVRLLNAETHHLRLLDRRLGSSTKGALVEAHALTVDDLMHRCVGPTKKDLAAALVEAATLAGWLALDGGDIPKSWQWHEKARAAAREAESKLLLGYVLGQESVVLAESGEVAAAVSVAAEAGSLVRGSAPIALRGWVAMTQADALAAAQDGAGARAKLEVASRLIGAEQSGELPFLMLSAEHVARWRGHCLTVLGDSAALRELEQALPGEGDSVRAAVGLHTDLATARTLAGDRAGAATELIRAMDLAAQCGSVRQLVRLERIRAS